MNMKVLLHLCLTAGSCIYSVPVASVPVREQQELLHEGPKADCVLSNGAQHLSRVRVVTGTACLSGPRRRVIDKPSPSQEDQARIKGGRPETGLETRLPTPQVQDQSQQSGQWVRPAETGPNTSTSETQLRQGWDAQPELKQRPQTNVQKAVGSSGWCQSGPTGVLRAVTVCELSYMADSQHQQGAEQIRLCKSLFPCY